MKMKPILLVATAAALTLGTLMPSPALAAEPVNSSTVTAESVAPFAGIQYGNATGDTEAKCLDNRNRKIKLLRNHGYTVDPGGGCTWVFTTWYAKFAYWK